MEMSACRETPPWKGNKNCTEWETTASIKMEKLCKTMTKKIPKEYKKQLKHSRIFHIFLIYIYICYASIKMENYVQHDKKIQNIQKNIKYSRIVTYSRLIYTGYASIKWKHYVKHYKTAKKTQYSTQTRYIQALPL